MPRPTIAGTRRFDRKNYRLQGVFRYKRGAEARKKSLQRIGMSVRVVRRKAGRGANYLVYIRRRRLAPKRR